MKKFDVAIAGGGVIGGAIALELARAGLHVAVFDRQHPGQEASWASAGILSPAPENPGMVDRKSTRLNSSHSQISYAVFCLKKKKKLQHGKHQIQFFVFDDHRNHPIRFVVIDSDNAIALQLDCTVSALRHRFALSLLCTASI